MAQTCSIKRVSAIALLVAMITFPVIAWHYHPLTQASPTINLPPMSLTLVALNGTQVVLNSSDIGNLPSYEARGGYIKKTGAIVGPDNYTGVPLSLLCVLVGGINSDNALRITAIDGYSITYSFAQANGDFVTYNLTGQKVPYNEPITPIIAFHKNDANLSSSEGPLRIAIVGSESLITESQYWSKQVVKLEIRYRDDVAVTRLEPQKTILGEGCQCRLSVTVENQGGYTETFTVTIYANTTVIATAKNIVLDKATSTAIILTWNTTGFGHGYYALKATVSAVPGETDTANNSLVDGTVFVGTVGDVNADREVDLRDVFAVSQAYGSSPGHAHWESNYDLNGDGLVDLKDFYQTCHNFGQSDP